MPISPSGLREAKAASLPASKTALLGALACALAPILAVYTLLFREMRNAPMFDDYQAIVSFALIFRQLPNLGSKLLFIVAAQHDEYKLIFEHMILAAQLALTGRISFTFLIVLGNLLLLGILWLLWKHYFAEEKNLARRILLFAPICYLIFQLNYVENLDWAMCGMQTVPVLLFTLAALHLVLKLDSRSIACACLCAFLACLSSANGFLIAPIGLFILLSAKRRSQTPSWSSIVAWTTTFFVALALYLYRYIPITRAGFDPHVTFPHKVFFFLAFLGAAAENMRHFPVRNGAVVLGLVILATFLLSLRTRFDRTNPFAFYSCLWFLLSAAAVTQGRAGLGMDISLSLRYKIYSDLLLIFCYGFGASFFGRFTLLRNRKQTLFAGALAATMLLSLSSDFFGYKALHKRRVRTAEGLTQFAADPTRNVPMISTNGEAIVGGEPEFARVVLNQALAQGIYSLPPMR